VFLYIWPIILNILKHTIYILAVVFVLITSCKEEKDCLDYGGNSGLILYEVEMGKCYSVLDTSKIIVNDTVLYKKLPQFTIDSVQQTLGCAPSPSRPQLNFDTITLLGAKTEAKGCIVTYERKVSYSDTDNNITYTIDIHECGECNENRISMNWVAIKKQKNINNLQVLVRYH